MPTVPDIHRRGTRAAQGSATLLTVGTLWFVTDAGITERWNGTTWEAYSGAGAGVVPPPAPGAVASTFLIAGGQVAWESLYTFRVSAASYYLNATPYTSAEQTVTLTAPDATLDRIDVIALDTTGTVIKITGTPSATPSEPSVDPAQYLKLALVFVTHATTAPPAVVNVLLYAENVGAPTEWNWTSSGASIVVGVNNASLAHAGTKLIEGTSVAAGVYAQGQIGTGTFDPADSDHLLLFLRSKATWNNARGLLVTLRNAGVQVGAAVQIRASGTFGFDSSITSGYQMVAIPLVTFSVPQGQVLTQVRIEDYGGAIGFYLDDVTFQAHALTPAGATGISQAQADALYAPLVHASRHSAGAADPVTVTALAGYPGGTTTFLRADGTFAAPSTTPRIGAVGILIDGGGSAITTGVKGFVECPFAGTITAATVLSTDAAVTSGSIVIDVWKDTYANYPPTVADTITASAKPTLSSATKSRDTTLVGWITSISAGDILGFKVDSATAVTRVVLSLTVQAT